MLLLLCVWVCVWVSRSLCRDCWFSWSLPNAWQPTDILCHWAPVRNHDSISPGNQGRAREWKNTHQGQAEWRAAEQRLASLGGFEGSGAAASSYIHLVPRPPWRVQYVWTWETLWGKLALSALHRNIMVYKSQTHAVTIYLIKIKSKTGIWLFDIYFITQVLRHRSVISV